MILVFGLIILFLKDWINKLLNLGKSWVIGRYFLSYANINVEGIPKSISNVHSENDSATQII